ncbi:pyrroline-5-carboxylate reductase [Candidatus Latescibacterota bacterium]
MSLGTLGLIGYGNMGSAIVKGLLEAGLFKTPDIHIYDIDTEKVEKAGASGHVVHTSISGVGNASGTVIVAVKPGDVLGTLNELRNCAVKPLIISIAAGVTLEQMESVCTENPIIRVMPNTPCMVGAGVSVITRGSKAGQEHAEKAKTILGAIGIVSEVPESLMDAVTGLSGSGPAYVALVIDALSDGGVKMGLPRETALKLAAQTVFGSAKMILEKKMHPTQLRDMVASPGGTTIEGISVLEESSFRAALIDAVEAATLKSRELSG